MKEEEIRKFYQGELVDWPMGVQSWSEPVREFWYGYDVFEEAERALKVGGELPEGWRWFGDVKKDVEMEGAGMV